MVKTNQKPNKKEYVVIYRSQEHYEVLGYVTANSLKEAKEKAQKELLNEAKYYEVEEAEIGELKDKDIVYFNIQ